MENHPDGQKGAHHQVQQRQPTEAAHQRRLVRKVGAHAAVLVEERVQHGPVEVPLHHLGQPHAPPQRTGKLRHVQLQHALVEHADQVVLLAHDARADVVRRQVAHDTQPRGHLRRHHARHQLWPRHGAQLCVRQAQLGGAERAQLQERRHLHRKAHRRPQPRGREDRQVEQHSSSAHAADGGQRVRAHAHHRHVALVRVSPALRGVRRARVTVSEGTALRGGWRECGGWRARIRCAVWLRSDAEPSAAHRALLVRAPQSTKSSKKPLNTMVNASVARFSTRLTWTRACCVSIPACCAPARRSARRGHDACCFGRARACSRTPCLCNRRTAARRKHPSWGCATSRSAPAAAAWSCRRRRPACVRATGPLSPRRCEGRAGRARALWQLVVLAAAR